MKLTGKQLKEINDALLEVFSRNELEQMLLYNLDKSLDHLVTAGDLRSVVFDLVRLAEREGWLPQLLTAAHEWRPENQRLAAVAQALQPAGGSPVSDPVTPLPPEALPRIDPDDPPYGALRRLLAESFDPGSLTRFCQFHPSFRPVLASFGLGQGLDDMIDRVLDHCRMYLLWDELVAGVAEVNPGQVRLLATAIAKP